MRKGIIFGVAVAVAIAVAGWILWPIGVCYMENDGLSSDMKDLAVQNRARLGLGSFDTEEGLREAVIARAKERGIPLTAERVTVQRRLTPAVIAANGSVDTPAMLDISLAADYDVPVNLAGLTIRLHFAPQREYSAPVQAP